MKLVIAEKPSVAQSLAAVIGAAIPYHRTAGAAAIAPADR